MATVEPGIQTLRIQGKPQNKGAHNQEGGYDKGQEENWGINSHKIMRQRANQWETQWEQITDNKTQEENQMQSTKDTGLSK